MGHHPPFDQLHHDEVTAVPRVVQDQAVRTGGLELEEEVHGRIGLQRREGQIAGLSEESHRIGHDVPHAEARVQLAVGDVAVLALVQKQHAVDRQRLQVANEVGRQHGDEAPLCHDPGLDVIKLQPGVGARHVACEANTCVLAPPAIQHLRRLPSCESSPSTVTLSTESCKFFPRRPTFTACHSLSFSFSPTRRISGPLPGRR